MDAVLSIVELGGPIVILLLAISVFTLALIISKLLQFRRLGVGRHRDARRAVILWRSGDRVRAAQLLSGKGSLCRSVLAFAVGEMRSIRETAGREAPEDRAEERVREEAVAFATDELLRLGAGLRFLDIVAQIAPLLGLLGTVIGMIEAFQVLQASGEAASPAQLAGGIWTALLTTATGIAVAIPALVASVWFEGRVERERSAIEVLLTGLFARGI